MRGFKNFLMRGDVIVVAVGLIVALAFSTLVSALTTNVINPIIARAEPGQTLGLGWQLGKAGSKATFLNIGSFISGIIYFVIFMAVIYFAIVVPYKVMSARRRDGFWRPAGSQDVPGLPVERPAGRRDQVQVLRNRPADRGIAGIAGLPPASHLMRIAGLLAQRRHRCSFLT